MINTIENIKQDFVKSTDEIVSFMDFIDLCKSQDFFFAKKSKFYKDIMFSIEETKDKIGETKDIQYNAIIISLYGAFELAIKNATNIFIKHCINKGFPFNDKLSKDYILSVIRTFERNTLNENKNIIKNLHLFFNENDLSKFNPELSLNNYQNLRMDVVGKIANTVGIEDLFNEIKISNDFLLYIKDREALSSIEQSKIFVEKSNNVFHYIDDIVADRNMIAHQGRASIRFDHLTIKQYIIREFKIVVNHYIDLLKAKWCQNCVQANMNIKKIDVLQIIDNSIICFNTKETVIDKNSKIIIKNGKNNYKIATIIAIQQNKQSIERAEINQDIGCRLDKRCKPTFSYYMYVE